MFLYRYARNFIAKNGRMENNAKAIANNAKVIANNAKAIAQKNRAFAYPILRNFVLTGG